MFQFSAINTEQKDNEPNIFPFDLRRFLDIIKSDKMVRLPKYYIATCTVCHENTFYRGQNRGKKLEVVPV
jgi:hypothetical protein